YFIVSYTLQSRLSLGDKTSIDEELARGSEDIPKLRKVLEEAKSKNKHDQWFMDYYYSLPDSSEGAAEGRTFTNMFLEIYQKVTIDQLPQRVKGNYDLYVYFCENVVEKLLLEKYLHDQD